MRVIRYILPSTASARGICWRTWGERSRLLVGRLIVLSCEIWRGSQTHDLQRSMGGQGVGDPTFMSNLFQVDKRILQEPVHALSKKAYILRYVYTVISE